MADPIAPQDRLQPALLDRLTDDEPDKKQEPREARVLSRARMRQAVLRDLAWLFNATAMDESPEFAKLPYAKRWREWTCWSVAAAWDRPTMTSPAR